EFATVADKRRLRRRARGASARQAAPERTAIVARALGRRRRHARPCPGSDSAKEEVARQVTRRARLSLGAARGCSFRSHPRAADDVSFQRSRVSAVFARHMLTQGDEAREGFVAQASGLPAWVAKRDGRLTAFEPDRIAQALFAASEALGKPDTFLARELTDGV